MHKNSSIKIDAVPQNKESFRSFIVPVLLVAAPLCLAALKSTLPVSFFLTVTLGLILVFCFQTLGLIVSYTLLNLFFFIACKHGQLWEMTLIYAVAINLYIVLMLLEKPVVAEEKNIVEAEAKNNPSLESQYKQLRQQFEEKSTVLSQTRKELFETQGKLIALQKERETEGNEKWQQNEELQKALEKEIETNQEHEKEISYLEQLISNILKK